MLGKRIQGLVSGEVLRQLGVFLFFSRINAAILSAGKVRGGILVCRGDVKCGNRRPTWRKPWYNGVFASAKNRLRQRDDHGKMTVKFLCKKKLIFSSSVTIFLTGLFPVFYGLIQYNLICILMCL